jgi:HKD family nuclease
MNQYSEYYWASAWASSKLEFSNDLKKQRNKIRRIVVGTHFYQTSPDFIEMFIDEKNVRFVKQTDDLFHPKLFVFKRGADWEMMLGSANFTAAGFTKNTEVMILLTSHDADTQDTIKKAMVFITDNWKNAEYFTQTELENYRQIYKQQKEKIKSLSGNYSGSKSISKKKKKPIFEIPILNMTWEEFMSKAKNEKTHGLTKRLALIALAKEFFFQEQHFNLLGNEERKFIAGIPNKLKEKSNKSGAEHWEYFGSMKGAGKFKKKIINNDELISKALDQIPLSGEITRTQYDRFIEYFSQALPGQYIATATRLLAMKRPDIFICLDSKNRARLCKDFSITSTGMDYNRYWEDIIARIQDSNWWQHPTPKNEEEEKVSEARAAFLDTLYYKQ